MRGKTAKRKMISSELKQLVLLSFWRGRERLPPERVGERLL
jgi:hypothetical protein